MLGTDGDRVVLAYTKKADLVARINLNGGDSFLAADVLLDVPFPSEVAAFASNADIKDADHRLRDRDRRRPRGSGGEGFIKRTTNDGGSWATVRVDQDGWTRRRGMVQAGRHLPDRGDLDRYMAIRWSNAFASSARPDPGRGVAARDGRLSRRRSRLKMTAPLCPPSPMLSDSA